MGPKNLSKLISITFGVLVLCFVVGFYVIAWTGPTADPPGDNVSPPATQLSNLTDVGTVSYTAGYVLRADGTDFDAAQLKSSDLDNDSGFISDITGQPLGDLSDVSITTPADDEVLTYETASGLWKNKTGGAGGGIGGSGTSSQVAFFTGATTLGSDGNLYWDNINKRLGVGVTPNYKLHIEGGSYGIYAKGDTMGGYFKDATQSGYANIAQGDYGVKAYGYEAGGYFESTDVALPGYAYVGKRGYGIDARGAFMGGHFEDSTDSGYADIGVVNTGINAYGDTLGGYFKNTGINGTWAYLATDNIGIEAYATSTGAGGYFKNDSTGDFVWLANGSTGRGVSATGVNYGVMGWGNTAGGYFKDNNSSGYAFVGVGNYGIQANGSFAGGYFNDTDGTYSRIAYGDYGLYTPGSIYFENALLPNGNAGNSGQVLTSQGSGAVPVWGDVSGGGLQSAARAYPSASQSIPASASTIVNFNTESFDNLGEYDTTNRRFVAQTTGHYLVHASVKVSSPTDGGRYSVAIYKNGGIHSSMEYKAGSAYDYLSLPVTDLIALNAGDNVQISVYFGDAKTILGFGSNSWFIVHRLD